MSAWAQRRSVMITRFMTRVSEFGVLLLALAMQDLRELFRTRPHPSDAPLVSGIAPSENGSTRPLSETQLGQLQSWLREHQKGWRRYANPPYVPSYSFQVEHSDGTTTDLLLFTHIRPEIRFTEFNNGRSDAGWLALPVAEVERLIVLLGKKS